MERRGGFISWDLFLKLHGDMGEVDQARANGSLKPGIVVFPSTHGEQAPTIPPVTKRGIISAAEIEAKEKEYRLLERQQTQAAKNPKRKQYYKPKRLK